MLLALREPACPPVLPASPATTGTVWLGISHIALWMEASLQGVWCAKVTLVVAFACHLQIARLPVEAICL